MEYSHKLEGSTRDTLEKLVSFIEARRRSDSPSADLADFETDVRELCSAVERAVTTEELARFDVRAPAVLVEGVVHRFVLRSGLRSPRPTARARRDRSPSSRSFATSSSMKLQASTRSSVRCATSATASLVARHSAGK